MSYVPLHDRPPHFSKLPPASVSHPGYPPTPRYASPDTGADLVPSSLLSVGSALYKGQEDNQGKEYSSAHGRDQDAMSDYDPDFSSDDGADVEPTREDGNGDEHGHGLAHGNGAGSVDAPPTPPSDVKHTRRTVPEVEGDIRRASGPESKVGDADAPRKRRRISEEHPPPQSKPKPRGLQPSFFSLTARNPSTRAIGEFILECCVGRRNMEVEIKLGSLLNKDERRLMLPVLHEVALRKDFPIGRFASDMPKLQQVELNRVLNQTLEATAQWRPNPHDPHAERPYPITYTRQRQTDEFHAPAPGSGGEKVRVSRDASTGQVLACIRKSRVGDLNVYNPTEVFDFRVSVSSEEECPMPNTPVTHSRSKDRLCYKHQLVQVDLTYVRSMDKGREHNTCEIEVEILDVPSLVAEGLKDRHGHPNQFDEMLTSILDSARILIRNALQPSG